MNKTVKFQRRNAKRPTPKLVQDMAYARMILNEVGNEASFSGRRPSAGDLKRSRGYA